jgi:[lysine-biosynthesis-protein LysW]---L-2-aminoadipate ligase
MPPRLAMLCSQIRTEEKLLLAACDQRGLEMEILDDRPLIWPAAGAGIGDEDRYDVILIRSISHSRALNLLRYYQRSGQPTVNTLEVATLCGDKLRTTNALSKAGVPSPTTQIAYTPAAALAAAEQLGYPVVLHRIRHLLL